MNDFKAMPRAVFSYIASDFTTGREKHMIDINLIKCYRIYFGQYN
jgi:hypothetical protein